MLYYDYQFKRYQTQEVLMTSNVVDGIIASMLFALLSTGVGLIFQALGFSSQEALFAGVSTLLFLLMLFLSGRNLYPKYKRKLTLRLVEAVLNSKAVEDVAFRNHVITKVLHDHPSIVSNQNCPIREFANQVACEAEICEAFRTARKVKILTIRGEKYFLSSRSLLYDLYLAKRGKDATVDMLVLSPNADHITEALARKLGHDDAGYIKTKMRIALQNLRHLSETNDKFKVKCYSETPNFKILLFDDVMFVSSFGEGGGPKNDQNARMWQMTREGNPIFIGLEKHFDKLWECSVPPQ